MGITVYNYLSNFSSELLPSAYISLANSLVKISKGSSDCNVVARFNVYYNQNSRTENKQPFGSITVPLTLTSQQAFTQLDSQLYNALKTMLNPNNEVGKIVDDLA